MCLILIKYNIKCLKLYRLLYSIILLYDIKLNQGYILLFIYFYFF